MEFDFSERAKTIALAIVKIFETSKPFGDYSAVAVLNDGAGISYGISQFTHKSGSLHAVLESYGKLGGLVPDAIIEAKKDFESGRNILKRSNDKDLRTALKQLGKDPLMQQAQREIAFERYLRPALEACKGSNFTLPLSLAVIYDSMNHGSYAKIRDRVEIPVPGNGSMPAIEFEKAWITEYVTKRDEWLESVPRLANTDYRTDFFLAQIARGNWQLNLPLNVHGFKLTEEILFPSPGIVVGDNFKATAETSAAAPATNPADQQASISEIESALPAKTEQPLITNEKEWTEGERPTAEPPPPPATDSGSAPGATTLDSQMSPQVLDRERPSLFSRVMTGIYMAVGTAIAGITATCGGNEIVNMAAKQGAQQVIANTDRSDLQTFGFVVAYVVLGLGAAILLFWIASKIWEKSSERANRLNLQKAAFAADKQGNTVEFKR